VLSEDDFATICGAVHWERNPDPDGTERSSYRDAPRRLVVCALEPHRLVVILGGGPKGDVVARDL
jgi:hypothetical protein